MVWDEATWNSQSISMMEGKSGKGSLLHGPTDGYTEHPSNIRTDIYTCQNSRLFSFCVFIIKCVYWMDNHSSRLSPWWQSTHPMLTWDVRHSLAWHQLGSDKKRECWIFIWYAALLEVLHRSVLRVQSDEWCRVVKMSPLVGRFIWLFATEIEHFIRVNDRVYVNMQHLMAQFHWIHIIIWWIQHTNSTSNKNMLLIIWLHSSIKLFY